MSLTYMDIKSLSQDPSPQVRAELAGKVAQSLQDNSFKLFEVDVAVDILRILARDLEVQVRRAVSLSLCHSMAAPHDVVLRLANDMADVAMPVLQFSKVLTDEELVQIAENAEEVMKLVALAKREEVSSNLSSTLINSGQEKVVYTLFKNPGANLTDDVLEGGWPVIATSQSLLETLVQRSGLSIGIAEKLYATVSAEMKRYLSSAYRLPSALIEDTVDEHREVKTLELSSTAQYSENEKEVEALVHQLYTSNRLTYSIVIRSLCNGDFAFFEAAMSRLAGVPRKNAHILIYDSGTLGFKAFYEKAKLPPAFYEAIRSILRIGLEIKAMGHMTTDEFRGHLVSRIQEEGLDYSIENMHYLLSLVMNNIADNPSGVKH